MNSTGRSKFEMPCRSKVFFPRSSFMFSCSSFIFCVFPCGEKHGEPCFSMCSTIISTAFVFAVSLSATFGARFDSFGHHLKNSICWRQQKPQISTTDVERKLYLLGIQQLYLCLNALAIVISPNINQP